MNLHKLTLKGGLQYPEDIQNTLLGLFWGNKHLILRQQASCQEESWKNAWVVKQTYDIKVHLVKRIGGEETEKQSLIS